MKVLVISAHPDDEIIGCGGTIARHTASGDNVDLLVMTQVDPPDWDINERKIRLKEVYASGRILGIGKIYFGKQPSSKLNTIPTIRISSIIYKTVLKAKPDFIYIPPLEDINLDHVIVAKAALASVKGLQFKKIISYEVPTSFNFISTPHNYFVDISNFIAKKLDAMKEYKTELKNFPHPRSLKGLEIIAQERGLAISSNYAEAFTMIREVEK